MSTEFYDMAAALSAPELEACARALLAELEGGGIGRRPDNPEGGETEAARLAAAFERLTADLASAGENAAYEARGIPSAAASAAGSAGGTCLALRPEPPERAVAGRLAYRTEGPEASGGFDGNGGNGPGASEDPEKFSELVRRDSRRYDAGFERY